MSDIAHPRVVHLPLNTPYARKIRADGKMAIVNTGAAVSGNFIPSDITFEWILRHAGLETFWKMFDILHVHFGFEFEGIEVVQRALQTVRSHKKPIVFTCHEIQSVHGSNQAAYEQYLRLLGRHATAIITLTEAARQSLQARYPREYQRVDVVPHGHVVSPDHPQFGYKDKQGNGIHFAIVGTFRSNRTIYSTVANLYYSTMSLRTTISFFTKPFSERPIQNDPHRISFLNFMQSDKRLRVFMAPYFPDDELTENLKLVDVLILPYSSSGHSGQLALALDIGLIPIVTNVGFLPAQYEETLERGRVSPPAVFVDWSDGQHWKYQERFVRAVLDVCENIEDYRNRLRASTEDWQEYRRREHAVVIQRHYEIYKRCLTMTASEQPSM